MSWDRGKGDGMGVISWEGRKGGRFVTWEGRKGESVVRGLGAKIVKWQGRSGGRVVR